MITRKPAEKLEPNNPKLGDMAGKGRSLHPGVDIQRLEEEVEEDSIENKFLGKFMSVDDDVSVSPLGVLVR